MPEAVPATRTGRRTRLLCLICCPGRPRRPIRLLSVTALYITESADSYQQLDLLAGDAPLRDQRQEQLESAMDAIRDKYGKDAIAFGHRGKMGWDD